ncbi:MAG: GNAT family N-acetyltransferase [Actinobacteria bacterium]|nr:GNAT family N-acetyltransferase [Actinomycetota bacterium]
MRFAVRRASPDEFELLPDIEGRSDLRFAALGMHFAAGQPTDLASLSRAYAVFVVGEPIAGFAMTEVVDDCLHLEALHVDLEQQGKGMGSDLLREIFRAEGKHFASITLVTFADVPWNAPFYARHGFCIVDELSPALARIRRREVHNGLDKLGRRVVMRRELP